MLKSQVRNLTTILSDIGEEGGIICHFVIQGLSNKYLDRKRKLR